VKCKKLRKHKGFFLNTIKGIYFITDSSLSKAGVLSDCRQAIAGGCSIIQYREKKKSTGEMLKDAFEIHAECKKSNCIFIVNDRIDIALAVDADGVHLGQNDMPLKIARKLLPKKIIGITVHTPEEAISAQTQGADYIAVSPIFPTKTKADAGKAVGIEMLAQIRKEVSIPIVAIAGINEENMLAVLESGADSIAMISEIICSQNIELKVKSIVKKIGGVK
jgi:thiamine-phosphate pyrophosphorylase